MVPHTRKMPYKCSSCSQQFVKKKGLPSNGIKLHGGPRPQAYPTCAKRVLSRLNLLCPAFMHAGKSWKAVCVRGLWAPGLKPKWPWSCRLKLSAGMRGPCEFCSHGFTQRPISTCIWAHTWERNPSRATSVAKPLHLSQPGQAQATPKLVRSPSAVSSANSPSWRKALGQPPLEEPVSFLLDPWEDLHSDGAATCALQTEQGVRKFEWGRAEGGYELTWQAHLWRHAEIHHWVEHHPSGNVGSGTWSLGPEDGAGGDGAPTTRRVSGGPGQGYCKVPGRTPSASESVVSLRGHTALLIITAVILEDCDT